MFENTPYQATFRRLFSPWHRLLVAFSGGLDSTVLLHQLSHWIQQEPATLRAVHIHHGISPFADVWAAHCQHLCDALAVPLEIIRVTLKDRGQGLEAQAREARYAAFASVLLPEEALVTAQHLDDQSETVLLALKRGSGPAGLAAMPEALSFANSVILRPLLHISRAELEHYAQSYQLSWVEDESNQDVSYDRNFLRQQILPLLCQRWPHFPRTLARSAQLCGEQEQLLDELLAPQLVQLVQPDGQILLAPLMAMSDIHRHALLRRWLALQGAQSPSKATLSRLWQEVALSRQDAMARLQMGEYEVRRFNQALWRVPCPAAIPEQPVCWRSPFAPLLLPNKLGTVSFAASGQAVRSPGAGETVSVRFRAPGLWHIVGRDRRRSLKKIWQELQTPPWLRGNIPLLFYDEQLIAAAGWFTTRQGRPQPDVPDYQTWYLHWQQNR